MAITQKDWDCVFAHPLFAPTHREDVRPILESGGCQVCVFSDGDAVHPPVATGKAAGILLSGRATVTTPDPAREALLRYLDAGELFGIAGLFDNAPSVSMIRAKGACRVFFLTGDAVKTLLEEDHVFLSQYLAFLSGRIRYLNQKIGYLTAGSAERRLALYLASYGEERIELDASISALSDLLDVGRASLYRAFDRLSADGFLQKEGRTLTLLDVRGMLRAYQ
jgi:CRP-like cAMP-binding protein